MLVKLYRYRIPQTGGLIMGVGFEPEGLVQRVTLQERGDPHRRIDLHWYRDEEAARSSPVSMPTGGGVELFPGAVLPEGSVLDAEEELDDPLATLLALAHPGLAARSLARDALVRALAERLREVVPAGFLSTALAAWLDRSVGWVFESGGDGPELVEEAARIALDALQDEIAESTGEPFPPRVRPGSPPLPEASAHFDGEALQAWYADADGPVWELEPIPADELQLGTLPGLRAGPARGFDAVAPPQAGDAPPELASVSTYGELLTLVLVDVMAPYDELGEFVDPAYDGPRIANALGLEVELAHALLYALRRLDGPSRVRIVRDFFARRRPRHAEISAHWDGQRTFDDHAIERRLAARAALEVLDLAQDPGLSALEVRDLLDGAAQGDPVVETPQAWSAAVKAAEIARRRGGYAEGESAAAATTAVREALDPRHGRMSLHDVVLSAARAIAAAGEPERLVDYFLAMDRAFDEAQGAR